MSRTGLISILSFIQTCFGVYHLKLNTWRGLQETKSKSRYKKYPIHLENSQTEVYLIMVWVILIWKVFVMTELLDTLQMFVLFGKTKREST